MPNQEPKQPPSFGQQLGLMYKRWTLDCVVSIAHAVSMHFSDCPELYQRITDATANNLTDLQGSYGFQPNFPNMEKRQRLMKPIFGKSDGDSSGNDDSSFQKSRLPLLEAASGFSNNAQPTTFSCHRERVRCEIVAFKNHMADLKGSSLSQTDKRQKQIFDIAQAILKDPYVSGVFGVTAQIDNNWPLESNDPQGAKLIEKTTSQLPDLPCGVISHEAFIHKQRVAEKGFQSIRFILDTYVDTSECDVDPLICELFAWGSELRLVGGDRPQQTSLSQPMSPMSGVRTSGATAYGH